MADHSHTGWLVEQRNARPISGVDLEAMGKTAARTWAEGKHANLNTAVIEAVKTAMLSPEQVQRVIEHTNTYAFKDDFAKQAGARSRLVHFSDGPADPAVVLTALNQGSTKIALDDGSNDYRRPPRPKTASAMNKTASAGGEERASLRMLKEAFEAASPGSTKEVFNDPLHKIGMLRQDLQSAFEDKTSELGRTEIHYKVASEHLYQQVKMAALEGISLGEVVRFLAPDVIAPELMKIAFERITPRLLEDRVLRKEDIEGSFQKVAAGGIRNADHPLAESYRAFQSTLCKLAALRDLRSELGGALAKVEEFMTTYRMHKTADSKGLIPALTELAEKASVPVGNAARGVGKALMGPGDFAELAGQVAENGTRYAPHIAGAVAVNEALNSPLGQRLTQAAGGQGQQQQPFYMY